MSSQEVRVPLLHMATEPLERASSCVLNESCFLADGTVSASPAQIKTQRKLFIACILCAIFMVVEVIGGYMAKSVAVMADAAHMLSDVGGFAISLFAVSLVMKRSHVAYSFGYHRAEVIGSLMSIMVIWAVTGGLVWEAVQRILEPQPVDGKIMFIISSAGIVFNILVALVLGHPHIGHSHGHGECGHGHSHDAPGHSHGKTSMNWRASSGRAASSSHIAAEHAVITVAIDPSLTSSSTHGTRSPHDSHSAPAASPFAQAQEAQTPAVQHHNHFDITAATSIDATQHSHDYNDSHNHDHSHNHDNSHDHSHNHSHGQHNESDDHEHGEGHGLEHNHDSNPEHGHAHNHEHVAGITAHNPVQQGHSPKPAATVGGGGSQHTPGSCCKGHGRKQAHSHSHLPGRNHNHHQHKERSQEHSHAHDHVHSHDHDHRHGHDHSHGHDGHEENLNLRSAILHVVGDLVQSIGVAIAGLLIWINQDDPRWQIADPICTFLFAFMVLLTTRQIILDIISTLMERTPARLDIMQVSEAMHKVEGVRDVHDLHVWSLSPQMPCMTAHVHINVDANPDQVLQALQRFARNLNINHATIQICNPSGDVATMLEPGV